MKKLILSLLSICSIVGVLSTSTSNVYASAPALSDNTQNIGVASLDDANYVPASAIKNMLSLMETYSDKSYSEMNNNCKLENYTIYPDKNGCSWCGYAVGWALINSDLYNYIDMSSINPQTQFAGCSGAIDFLTSNNYGKFYIQYKASGSSWYTKHNVKETSLETWTTHLNNINAGQNARNNVINCTSVYTPSKGDFVLFDYNTNYDGWCEKRGYNGNSSYAALDHIAIVNNISGTTFKRIDGGAGFTLRNSECGAWYIDDNDGVLGYFHFNTKYYISFKDNNGNVVFGGYVRENSQIDKNKVNQYLQKYKLYNADGTEISMDDLCKKTITDDITITVKDSTAAHTGYEYTCDGLLAKKLDTILAMEGQKYNARSGLGTWENNYNFTRYCFKTLFGYTNTRERGESYGYCFAEIYNQNGIAYNSIATIASRIKTYACRYCTVPGCQLRIGYYQSFTVLKVNTNSLTVIDTNLDGVVRVRNVSYETLARLCKTAYNYYYYEGDVNVFIHYPYAYANSNVATGINGRFTIKQ